MTDNKGSPLVGVGDMWLGAGIDQRPFMVMSLASTIYPNLGSFNVISPAGLAPASWFRPLRWGADPTVERWL